MRLWLLPLVLLSLLATACGGDVTSAPDGRGLAATEDSGGADLQVVAAVYPLDWVAARVAPDAEVDLLNQGSKEAHDIELSPPQRATIETADVVLYMGDIDYQPQVEDAVAAARGEVVNAVEVAGDDALLAASADAHAHEDEVGAHESEGEEGKGHPDEQAGGDTEDKGDDPAGGAGGVDPHLWFDTAIMAKVAVATGEAFATADPDNAQTYRKNAAAVREEMAALADDLDRVLGGDCAFDEAIVSHAAYAYLLRPYGKRQHAMTNVSAEGDPSPGELANLVREIKEEGFTHVLAEPVEGREAAEAVAREAGVKLLEISPLDAVSDGQAATGLPDLIRAQADAFATALGCA
ncbi:MAG: metal ABC transporter substrate-binding protein [Actinomycetota bacterium]|nr:metal ABC transporter substrate-binding protein [Actinomycetota bacterium]